MGPSAPAGRRRPEPWRVPPMVGMPDARSASANSCRKRPGPGVHEVTRLGGFVGRPSARYCEYWVGDHRRNRRGCRSPWTMESHVGLVRQHLQSVGHVHVETCRRPRHPKGCRRRSADPMTRFTSRRPALGQGRQGQTRRPPAHVPGSAPPARRTPVIRPSFPSGGAKRSPLAARQHLGQLVHVADLDGPVPLEGPPRRPGPRRRRDRRYGW